MYVVKEHHLLVLVVLMNCKHFLVPLMQKVVTSAHTADNLCHVLQAAGVTPLDKALVHRRTGCAGFVASVWKKVAVCFVKSERRIQGRSRACERINRHTWGDDTVHRILEAWGRTNPSQWERWRVHQRC